MPQDLNYNTYCFENLTVINGQTIQISPHNFFNFFNSCSIYDNHPFCVLDFCDMLKLGNGICDYGYINTADCGYDGGDCLSFNEICAVPDTSSVGDGFCDGSEYNIA